MQINNGIIIFMDDKSAMFRLSSNDFIRSAATSIFVAGIAALYGLTSQGSFDLFSADWVAVGKLVINSSFIAFMARISEKFVTASNGKVFGRIG